MRKTPKSSGKDTPKRVNVSFTILCITCVLQCLPSVSTPATRPQKGRGGLPSAAVLFCLLEVAQRGQLRPRRQGPSFPEGPAGQGPPRMVEG